MEERTTEVSWEEAEVQLNKELDSMFPGWQPKKVEEESKLLQVEACMVFAEEEMVSGGILKKLDYDKRTANSLESNSWVEAAQEFSSGQEEFYIKPLRTQRVMRPL